MKQILAETFHSRTDVSGLKDRLGVEPEQRGSTFALNVAIQLLHYTFPDPRRQQCLALCPQQPAIGPYPESHDTVHAYVFTINFNVVSVYWLGTEFGFVIRFIEQL
jgi:hypothetical protein